MARKKKIAKNREHIVIMYFFFILFLAMMAYFVYFMVMKSESFISSPYNSLQDLFSERVVRGDIISADGETLATTKVADDGTEDRSYPYGRIFAHAVGYASNGKTGLENQTNFSLLRTHEFALKQVLSDLSGNKSQGDNIVTTLDTEIQKTAYEGLGNYEGAVIAMQPSTGKIVAMVSKPDYDPNTIAEDWSGLTSGTGSALVNRATQGCYAPGSVFKIATVLEYYRENTDSYKDYTYDCNSSITVEGATIHCAGNQSHGNEDLKSSFAHSCNSSFANLSLTLNRSKFSSTCKDLLFNQDLPIAFDSTKSSFSLTKKDSSSMAMETGIGQGKTMVSPLHMLLVASAIDNDGVLMTPYLVDRIENPNGITVSETKQKTYGSLMTEDEAGVLQKYMRAVVTEGTGTKLSGQSYEASGKTGTAQVSDSSDQTNAWFVGYAKKDGYDDLAVAIIVENSGAGSTYAVPIAKKIFDVYFN
jgi:peptidoglycan glycosyltransferase